MNKIPEHRENSHLWERRNVSCGCGMRLLPDRSVYILWKKTRALRTCPCCQPCASRDRLSLRILPMYAMRIFLVGGS